ncbi:MAG: hypothetical protein FWF53_09145 [Candidatus Azobacteroides sp.]|nr:hypothetical protein [Candidatus Azobacteroides sp.]
MMRIDEEKNIRITLNVSDCTEGVYLRWINKLGEWCYYLFTVSSESNEVKNADNIVEFLRTVDFEDGYNPGTHRIQKESQTTIRLFAPLVDRETFMFLKSLPGAIYVDMFCGYENNEQLWIGVNIADGTFVKDKSQLQDFECTLILPKTFNHEL